MLKVDYINHMGDDLTVVNAARVSFGKLKTKLEDKDIKLIDYLAKNMHYSPFEHCTLSVRVKCPLYIRSQIHRHRTFSYNEISRRYTEDNIEFYVPEKYRKQHQSSKQCSDGEISTEDNSKFIGLTESLHSKALELYKEMIGSGVSREMARGVLPQNLMTEFIMTGNLRNWMGFLKLRLDNHTQEEARIIAEQVKQIITSRFSESAKDLFKYL